MRNTGLGVVAAAALLTAGCSDKLPENPSVESAWARLPAAPGRPAAAYFTLHGGRAADRLLAVTSPQVSTVELHEGMADASGMMTMRPLGHLDLPAGATVRLAPGGNHAMLFGLDRRVRAGDRIALKLSFASGRTLAASARTISAGDPAPAE